MTYPTPNDSSAEVKKFCSHHTDFGYFLGCAGLFQVRLPGVAFPSGILEEPDSSFKIQVAPLLGGFSVPVPSPPLKMTICSLGL